MLNGPFAIVLGFNGGMVALNDRIKLRPLVAARQGSILMVASEESALRTRCSTRPTRSGSPRAGEPVIAPGAASAADKAAAPAAPIPGSRREPR